MYILPEKKLIFLSQPKTGSTSVGHAVVTQLGGFPCGEHHSTPESVGLDTTGYTLVTNVRNHFDVMVSYWFASKCTHIPLEDFIDQFLETNGHVKRVGRHYYLYHTYPEIADKVLRYENLQEEFNFIVGQEVELPKLNCTNHGPYQQYYRPKTIQKVQSLFKPELAKYNYKWQS